MTQHNTKQQTQKINLSFTIENLFLKNLSLDEIQNELRKIGIERNKHFIRNVVYRIRQKKGLLKTSIKEPDTETRAPTEPEKIKILESKDFKNLIPKDNGYIDTNGYSKDIIKAFEHDRNETDTEKESSY